MRRQCYRPTPWGFLVLDNSADVARFREAVRPQDHPEDWFAAFSGCAAADCRAFEQDAYLDRYALPDKGFADRSDAWWPTPYRDRDIDTGSRYC